MISLETKAESASSSPIGLSISKEEEPTLSFSELLRGVKDSKDGKTVQNGALVLSLASEGEDVKSIKTSSKKETLLSLLKHDEKASSEVLELHPKITENLSVKEIKTLVADAKEFLKNKIIQSDDYKRSQVKDLPKTLKGLAEMAKKFGVDVSKITVEDVKPTMKVEPDVDADIKVKTQHSKNAKAVNEQDSVQEIKVDDKRVETQKDIKTTPLFKAQDKTEHTTEQLVQTKQFKVEEKTPKTKADETLKLLLRGEKPTQANTSFTADFSVATAKVIAPQATSEASKSLEQLLRGEVSETQSKTDGLATHKADSFEVKLNEAKQMVKYLSQDVKTAIEDYKSPFTRVKVQLNPQKLGDVDLTIVQRGKNLHVSLSSNNAAINTLSMNANELRAQLTNNGINNATLNFNNQDSNNSQAGQQEQHRQREQQAQDEYNYFDNEEQSEEILSSLEIVVPNYA